MFGFARYLAPRLLKGLYWAGLAAGLWVALAVGLVAVTEMAVAPVTGLLWLTGTVLGYGAFAALWRVLTEAGLVLFDINAKLAAQLDATERLEAQMAAQAEAQWTAAHQAQLYGAPPMPHHAAHPNASHHNASHRAAPPEPTGYARGGAPAPYPYPAPYGPPERPAPAAPREREHPSPLDPARGRPPHRDR